jgi:hypothetical protein
MLFNFELNPVMASTFSGIPSLPGCSLAPVSFYPENTQVSRWLLQLTSLLLFLSRKTRPTITGEKPGKRKQDDKEYQDGSDYYQTSLIPTGRRRRALTVKTQSCKNRWLKNKKELSGKGT